MKVTELTLLVEALQQELEDSNTRIENFRVRVAVIGSGIGQSAFSEARRAAHIHRKFALSLVNRRRNLVDRKGNEKP